MPDDPRRSNRIRIRAVRVVPYALPFRQPFRTAHEVLTVRRGFAVWVSDDQGRLGVGEAAPLPGFGMESLEACALTLSNWQVALPGNPVELPALWSPALASGLGVVPNHAHRPAAQHGLECALLDLAAQAAGVPLARWLHPAAAADVALNATLGATAPEEAAAQALAWQRQGFATLKLKVGVGGDLADIARAEAVRLAVGTGVRLRLDANEAWSEEQAARMARRLAPLDIEYIEQPVPAGDLAALARIRASSPIPVAADEAAATAEGAAAVLRERAAHILVLKPMALGGVVATLRIARLAFEQGIPVVITTMLEGVYGRTAALHAAAALPALAQGRVPTLACGLATGHLLAEDLADDPPQPHHGRLAVPQVPGLGAPVSIQR
jgi:o-succinylbenzoate synthase